MTLPLCSNAESFGRALCRARARLVTARRNRSDSDFDDHFELILAKIDALLDMTQSGAAESEWQQCALDLNNVILASRIVDPDRETQDCLDSTRNALHHVGLL
ncbi:hypothetical protein ACS7SF_23930 (plasmid) [Ralstonia sp. 25C]|uniref:hypothetical protein n=1 Tax=Ralstonia sp. 25C TaxID=3447363 RepID=UPI003F7566EC